ncbi:MAG TPA: TolC family protein, partial [Candidatus Eremiobacteraceae bacterium]
SVAMQAAKIAQVQYKVGLGSQIDVTTAEQTYLQAAKQLLDAQVAYALAADRLKLATGTLVE